MRWAARKMLWRLEDGRSLHVVIVPTTGEQAVYYRGRRVELPFTVPDWPWPQRIARSALTRIAG